VGAGLVAESGATRAQRGGVWNFFMLGGDIAFFSLALSIASVYTVFPLFASHLGADNTIVALIPAIRALGVFAPQLLIAGYVERLRRVKPMIMTLTIGERLPVLIIGVAALMLATRHAGLTLGVFLLMTLIPALSSGLTFPAWYDLIGRAIPQTWMGRFLGIWMGIGGALGALGSLAAAALIASFAFPLNFALCFLLAFVAYVVSFGLLALGREPARQEAPHVHVSFHAQAPSSGLVEQLAILRSDGAFTRYLVANAISGAATMAGALFAVAAAKQGGLSDAAVGVEGVVLAVAMTLGNFLWGFVGDHLSHRAVLVWGSVCAGLSAALALGAHGVWWFGAAFFLLGLSVSATQLAQLTATGEFGPTDRRASYIALMSVAYAPFAVGAPLLGGWLADHWGYSLAFALSAALGLLAAFAYAFWGPRASAKRIEASDATRAA
jgi:MFS family permease